MENTLFPHPEGAIRQGLNPNVIACIEKIVGLHPKFQGIDHFIQREILPYFRTAQQILDTASLEEFLQSGTVISYNPEHYHKSGVSIAQFSAPHNHALPFIYQGNDYWLMLDSKARTPQLTKGKYRLGFELKRNPADPQEIPVFLGFNEKTLLNLMEHHVLPELQRLVEEIKKESKQYVISKKELNSIEQFLLTSSTVSPQACLDTLPEVARNILRQLLLDDILCNSDYGLKAAYVDGAKFGITKGILARGTTRIILRAFNDFSVQNMAYSYRYTDLVLDFLDPPVLSDKPGGSSSKQSANRRKNGMPQLKQLAGFVELLSPESKAALSIEEHRKVPQITEGGKIVPIVISSDHFDLYHMGRLRDYFHDEAKFSEYAGKALAIPPYISSVSVPHQPKIKNVFFTLSNQDIVYDVAGSFPTLNRPFKSSSIRNRFSRYNNSPPPDALRKAWIAADGYYFSNPNDATSHYRAIQTFLDNGGKPEEIAELIYFSAPQALAGNFLSPLNEMLNHASIKKIDRVAQHWLDQLKANHPNGLDVHVFFRKNPLKIDMKLKSVKLDAITINDHNRMLWYLDAIMHNPWQETDLHLKPPHDKEILPFFTNDPQFTKQPFTISDIEFITKDKFHLQDYLGLVHNVQGAMLYRAHLMTKRLMLDTSQICQNRKAFRYLRYALGRGRKPFYHQFEDFEFETFAALSALLFIPPSAYLATDGRILPMDAEFIYNRFKMPIAIKDDVDRTIETMLGKHHQEISEIAKMQKKIM